MDFGGGYGLMCHMFEELVESRPTYILVDLPELLAVQYVFLRATGSIPITAHTEMPVRVRRDTVNLVPVELLTSSELECDLFISTFALSETPVFLQRLVAQRAFFGADFLYLTGQNTGASLWSQYSLVEMDLVRTAARQLYDVIRIDALPAVSAWELTAERAVGSGQA
jgi:hypothetical protein